MGSRIETLYSILLAIETSIDLDTILEKAVNAFCENLDCYAGVVLFFKDSIDDKMVYRVMKARPQRFDKTAEFHSCLKNENLESADLDLNEIRDHSPIISQFIHEGTSGYYYIFLLPNIGLFFLFKKSVLLDADVLEDLAVLVIKFSGALSACLQRMECEVVSESTMAFNRDLKFSESRLLQTLREKDRTQEELAKSRNHLALILQSLAEGVIVLGAQGIILMNIKAMEYLDFIGSAYLPSTIEGMFAFADNPQSVYDFIKDDSVDESEMEIRINGQRSEDRFLKLKKSLLANIFDDGPETILLIQDVTAEKEVDRLKNDFISNLSHELRTPMNAIIGISKVLGERGIENLTERQKEGLSIINVSGIRLLSLINDLLDISKIESGKMEIFPSSLSIVKTFDSLRSIALSLIGDKPIRFIHTLDRAVPEFILTDGYRLEQVMINLISNAVKFTESGKIEISVSVTGSRLYFSCCDSGIGITKEDLPFIFERFRQVDGSSTRQFSGTGLGLSLAQKIVALLGGEIFAESEIGKGTTVRFYIPLQVPDENINEMTVSSTGESKQKICRDGVLALIVDDEEIGRKTVSIILDSECDLVFAENGNDAIDQFKKNRPDIVLMDIAMPELDGYAALAQIRALEGGMHVPVVAVTARAMKDDEEKIRLAGFDDYLTKPVDPDKLRMVVAEYTNKTKRCSDE